MNYINSYSLNNEDHKVVKGVLSNIKKLYAGKAIPVTGYHYLNIISSYTDPILCSLFLLWRILEENTFNKNFRSVIITRNKNAFLNTIHNLHNSHIFDSNKVNILIDSDLTNKLKGTGKGKVNRGNNLCRLPELIILDMDDKKAHQYILDLIPDIVIVDEIYQINPKSKLCELIKELCT